MTITETGFEPAYVRIDKDTYLSWVNTTTETLQLAVTPARYMVYLPLLYRGGSEARSLLDAHDHRWKRHMEAPSWMSGPIPPQGAVTFPFTMTGTFTIEVPGLPFEAMVTVVEPGSPATPT
ncbi:MAG: hypothetical protein EOM24_20010, partial [Chloroflexia bacterium]|nr:hypothetical protein [Chloroflexia bacterium]